MRAHFEARRGLARLCGSALANGALIALAALATGVAGCNGCLGFDHYHLVNGPIGGGGSGASGGFGGSGGSSIGGGGGAACQPSTEDGAVTAAFVVADGETPSGNACGTNGATPGIDVVSLDALDGSCIASALVAASAGTVIGGPPSVRFDRAGNALIAGSFRKGTLTFPSSCDGPDITLDGATGTTQALYFAQLRKQGAGFCTAWARGAFTSDAGAAGKLHVEASAVDETGVFGVTGTLGQALVHFGDAGGTADLAGGPFVVVFDSFGSLEGLAGLGDAAATDAALGVAAMDGGWLASGVVQNARPSCHGCMIGSDAVDGTQAKCAGSGAGGGGGMGGAGIDNPNATIWAPDFGGSSCALTTFGSDTKPGDAQVGFGLIFDPAPSSCNAYWTGVAGDASWSVGGLGLFAGAGQTADAFLAQLDGASGIGCSGSFSQFTQRLVPSIAGATAWGHRVGALACSAGVVATTVVRDAAGGRVDVHRCTGTGASPCDLTPFEATLASDATDQLLVTGFDASGLLTWSGAIGPLVVDAAAAPLPGRARDDLIADDRGASYVVLTTDGPLVTEHLDAGSCDLVSTTDPGTWLLAFDGAGSSGKAACTWARRLGP